jgi:hypothetical protein
MPLRGRLATEGAGDFFPIAAPMWSGGVSCTDYAFYDELLQSFRFSWVLAFRNRAFMLNIGSNSSLTGKVTSRCSNADE